MNINDKIKEQMELARRREDNRLWEEGRNKKIEAIDYYEGEQMPYLKEYLSSLMSLRGDELLLDFQNITKKVINGTSLAYINDPIRLRDSEQDTKYNRWTRDKNAVMLKADRYTSLVDYVGIKVEWSNSKNKFRYRLLKNDVYFNLDQYGEDVEAVWFRIQPRGVDAKKHRTMFEYWDKDSVYIVDEAGVPSKNQAAYGFNSNTNPYGVIPIYILGKDFKIANDLIVGNRNVNALLTLLNELIKFRSFGLPYATGLDGQEKLKMSYKYIMQIQNPDAKVGMLDMEVNLDQVWKVLLGKIQAICESFGVSFSIDAKGNVSGFALLVDNIELYDNIKVDNATRAIWEEGIYDIEMAITKVKNPPVFTINFVEYTLPVSKDEQIKWENHQLKYGMTNPIELMQKNDPDLSEERAKEKYEENLALMQEHTAALDPNFTSK